MLLPLGGRGKFLVTWSPGGNRQDGLMLCEPRPGRDQGGDISEGLGFGVSVPQFLPPKCLPVSVGVKLEMMQRADTVVQGPETLLTVLGSKCRAKWTTILCLKGEKVKRGLIVSYLNNSLNTSSRHIA